MEIRKVKIVSNTDVAKDGMLAVIDSTTGDIYNVFYTSPFGANKNGGFISIPQVGQLCLICSPSDQDNSWYYMSSVWGKNTINNIDMGEYVPYYSPEEKIMGIKDKTLPKRADVYDKNGGVIGYVWESPAGNKVVIKDGPNPSVSLYSQKGKFVQLNDGPKGDAIVIQNEFGDRISLTNLNNNESGTRGISLMCKGNVTIESQSGTVNIDVVDSGEINIVNRSKKEDLSANVNLTSYNGQLNLTSYGENGSINMITKAEDSNINLKSAGNITLEAQGKLSLKSVESLDITTLGTLSFEGVGTNFNSILLQQIFTGIDLAAAFIPSLLIDVPKQIKYNSIDIEDNDYND
jgi:hypothetical protein